MTNNRTKQSHSPGSRTAAGTCPRPQEARQECIDRRRHGHGARRCRPCTSRARDYARCAISAACCVRRCRRFCRRRSEECAVRRRCAAAVPWTPACRLCDLPIRRGCIEPCLPDRSHLPSHATTRSVCSGRYAPVNRRLQFHHGSHAQHGSPGRNGAGLQARLRPVRVLRPQQEQVRASNWGPRCIVWPSTAPALHLANSVGHASWSWVSAVLVLCLAGVPTQRACGISWM